MAKHILQKKCFLNPGSCTNSHIFLCTHTPLPHKQKGNGICVGLQKGSAESPSESISRPCHKTPGSVASCASGFQAA